MVEVVIDASAVVDLLLGNQLGESVASRISGTGLHAPAHLDAECLSALGRLNRAGALSETSVARMLTFLELAPIVRHPLGDLLAGAWTRRGNLRLADALYVQLAHTLDLTLVTTDTRLRPVERVDVISSNERS